MQGVHLRKYGVEATIDFEVYEVDGVDLRVDWVPAQADCEIMKDGGASTQCDNTATDEGSTFSIVLTATEMEFARGVLKIVDAATKVFLDKVIIIETYGHPSAMHAFDLGAASESVSGTLTVETADTVFNLTATSGTLSDQDDCYHDMVICFYDNSGGIYETKRITDYDGTNTRVTVHENISFPGEDGVDTWVIYRGACAPVGAASITEGDKDDIADKVWDEADTDHMTPGSKGLKMHHSGRGRY